MYGWTGGTGCNLRSLRAQKNDQIGFNPIPSPKQEPPWMLG